MHQKRNSNAGRFIALFSVISIAISLFALSSTVVYAINGPSTFSVTLKILRPTTSTVGSVRITDTDNNSIANKECVGLPQQNNAYTAFQAGSIFDNKDHILIEHFPDAGCSASGFPNTSKNVKSPANHLGTNCGHACREYVTP